MVHARYVKTLPFASMFWDEAHHQPARQAGEFWLLHSDLDKSRILYMHNSNTPHYEIAHPRSMYEKAVVGHGCRERVKDDFMATL